MWCMEERPRGCRFAHATLLGEASIPPPAARAQVELRAEARHQVEHFRNKNKAALLNLLSDGACARRLSILHTYIKGF